MKILAIDPGTNLCGLAFFEDGILTGSTTITTKHKDPVKRRVDILTVLSLVIPEYDLVISEAPVLMGANNNGFQRFLGVIEFITSGAVIFFHPMTVKKAMGTGSLEKLGMAIAAGEFVQTVKEKEIIADIIQRDAMDESDAVCVGLTYLKKSGGEI